MTGRLLAKSAAICVAAGLTTAALAQENKITIELNDAATVNGACRLVFVAMNRTGQLLEKTSYDVVTFDSGGKVGQSLTFQFGRLPVGKTKVVQFDLPGQACDTISRLLVNDVSECVVDGKASDVCLDDLATSTRAAMEFTL